MALNAHFLIVKTAKEMAEELFEVFAGRNDVYAAINRGDITKKQARRRFVNRMAPKLYEDARAALVACLARPDSEVTVGMKDEIAEALIADAPLRANRLVAKEQAVVPPHLH